MNVDTVAPPYVTQALAVFEGYLPGSITHRRDTCSYSIYDSDTPILTVEVGLRMVHVRAPSGELVVFKDIDDPAVTRSIVARVCELVGVPIRMYDVFASSM